MQKLIENIRAAFPDGEAEQVESGVNKYEDGATFEDMRQEYRRAQIAIEDAREQARNARLRLVGHMAAQMHKGDATATILRRKLGISSSFFYKLFGGRRIW